MPISYTYNSGKGFLEVVCEGVITDEELLRERMAYYNVPGVSIAVINDLEIEWARGYGVLAAGRREPVTPETLFQVASIAKPVVAIAALQQVEAGVLGLDRDQFGKLHPKLIVSSLPEWYTHKYRMLAY